LDEHVAELAELRDHRALELRAGQIAPDLDRGGPFAACGLTGVRRPLDAGSDHVTANFDAELAVLVRRASDYGRDLAVRRRWARRSDRLAGAQLDRTPVQRPSPRGAVLDAVDLHTALVRE